MQSKLSGSSRAGGVGTTLSLVLLATLLIAAVTLFCFKHLQPKIERDLTARVAAALPGSAADFTIDGQNVILTGAVSSDAAAKSAEESALSVYGVSGVTNNLTIDGNLPEGSATPAAEPAESVKKDTPLIVDNQEAGTAPPTLTITARDGKIITQGIVPDSETIERINTALEGKFGRDNIRNEVSTFDGGASPIWLGGMLSMIDQLDGIDNPVLKITGNDLVVSGTVNNEQLGRVKIATAERLLGAELSVIDNLTVEAPEPEIEAPVVEAEDTAEAVVEEKVAEVADEVAEPEEEVATATNTAPAATTRPASVEIRSRNNQISLSGFVASDADASALRQGLDNLFGINGYDDDLTISNTVRSAPWVEDALIVTSELRDVPNFAIDISAGQMNLSGSVEDRETARDLAISATEIAGDKLGVLNNFSVDTVNAVVTDEDLMAQSLLQELDALPTSNIIFNKNSTTLADSAQEVLDDVAAAILGYNDLVVEIAGHTDSSGDAVTNLRLSKERATVVRDYLLEKNVPASRLSPIGYGETAPIRDNETDSGRAANRRIEFNL